MAIYLTETAIGKAARDVTATGKQRDLYDAGCRGLVLRLTANGAKSFNLSCRDLKGKARRFVLGHYPQMGIGDARNTARALHVHIKSGGADPSKEKARLRAIGRDAKAGVGTLEALLDLYEMKGKPGAKLKSWKAQRQAIENVFAKHLARPLAMIKASDLQMSADAHRAEYAAALGVRCLRPVLRWGSVPARGFAPAGLVDIHPPATVQRRERVLTADELRSLLPTLATSPLPYAAAMRFMLWTLARREEVSSARWHDVDFETGVWTIPAAAAKNGKEHRVPLPRQALCCVIWNRESLTC